MSGNPDDPWLIALAVAVSDGAAIDWDSAEQRPLDAARQRLVKRLRQLSAIVDAHRATAAAPASPNEPHPAVDPPSHWRHLVLFECVGRGAFGVVHRGWDPLLDREVAVKLLPVAGTGTTEPLDEARHLARVRHSNVVVVHGADEDEEKTGIWMEYIEGQALADIVRERGPMSSREVAGIGVDLCSALSAIHAAGLLHRDIKAPNVMRETGGRIVLMDFSGADTVTLGGGKTVFSGTPLYMAPELLEGAPATVATDVYSLGVLFFFLLTGTLPVAGSTADAVRRAHARGQRTRLRDVRPDLPDGLVQVVERATAADGTARYRTAGELEHALAGASGSASAVIAGNTARTGPLKRPRRARAWAAALGALSVGAALMALPRWVSTARPPLLARFAIDAPSNAGSWPRLSPDGRLIVYGTIVEGRQRFWVRSLDASEGRPLATTIADETPFWSPDSSTLCFFADGKLIRIPVDGGEAQVLAEAPRPHGGDWSGDHIVFASGDGLYRLSPAGGPPQRLTRLDVAQGDFQHAWPEFLPDGRRFLYVIRSTRAERAGVYLGSVSGDAHRRVMPAFSRVAYAEGHLLFVRDGALIAQPFDRRSARLHGEPVVLAGGVKHHAGSDAAFDVSDSRVLIYSGAPGLSSTRLVLFDRLGRELRALSDVGAFGHPRFSPDGQRVVAEKTNPDDQTADLWVYGVSHQSATRLTSSPAPDVRPVWSPDGRRIAFSSRRGAVYDIYAKTVDSIAEEELLFTAPGDKYIEHWSANLPYVTGTVLRSGLWLFPLTPDERPRMLRAGASENTWQSEFSPDGKWLAYMSTESGGPEVYV
ncbi:MAG: protein kinase domain-containing protein, partial [Vicinamibacterales bacterium]